MSIYPIIKMGHPTLREVARPVGLDEIDRPEMHTLIADMVETLHQAGGIGLAAPQIDQPIQLAIIEVPGGPSRYGDIEAIPLTVFFNPVLTVLNQKSPAIGKGVCPCPVYAVSYTDHSTCVLTTQPFRASRHPWNSRAFWPP